MSLSHADNITWILLAVVVPTTVTVITYYDFTLVTRICST